MDTGDRTAPRFALPLGEHARVRALRAQAQVDATESGARFQRLVIPPTDDLRVRELWREALREAESSGAVFTPLDKNVVLLAGLERPPVQLGSWSKRAHEAWVGRQRRINRIREAQERRRWLSLVKVLTRLGPRVAALYAMLPAHERRLVTGFLYAWADGRTESVAPPNGRILPHHCNARYRIERAIDPTNAHWHDDRIGWEARAVIVELLALADRDGIDVETFLPLILDALAALAEVRVVTASTAPSPPGDPPSLIDLLVRSVRPTNGPNAAAPTCAPSGHAWALAA